MTKKISAISCGKLDSVMSMPGLLDIQTSSFAALLRRDEDAERADIALERVFQEVFPIADVNGNYSLEFVSFSLGAPKYTVPECIERDMTYSASLKATLRLVINETLEGDVTRPKNILEKEVYLGELPILTPLGTFVINGAERVVVSQLHRSPGVVFEENIHPNGQRLFNARIIPFRGSWVEFTVDIHDVVYVHIDKKKKFPATALLRAIGYGTDAEILQLFYATRQLDLSKTYDERTLRREVIGAIAAETVPNPEGKDADPLVQEGEELTEATLEQLRENGGKTLTVFTRYAPVDLREDDLPTTMQGQPEKQTLAFDVPDVETGEVLAESGKELTATLRKKLLKAGVVKVDVLITTMRGESQIIKHTLAKDPTSTEAEALQQIYSLLRPGRSAESRNGESRAGTPVLQPQALRFG